jgi:chemotaxis protein methyltransferase CheR
MGALLSEKELEQLSAFLSEQVGLHFRRERWKDMERGILSAANEFEFDDASSCLGWLLSAPLSRRQVEVLASHLTVGETYFFREKGAFETLREKILPELIRARQDSGKYLRIWSAGCASGEESYSIAILLREMLGRAVGWNLTVLATDINPRALRKAAEGVYGDWSFRGDAAPLREIYFRKSRGGHEVFPEIKSTVSFDFLNLAEDAYPSLSNNTNAMDIIFCRNVLMYFEPAQAQRVVHKFHSTLVDGGWLIVSACEASSTLFSEFASLHTPAVTLYRKSAARQSQAVSWIYESAPADSPADAFPNLAGPAVEEGGLNPPFEDFSAPMQTERAAPVREPSPFEAACRLYARGQYGQVVLMLGPDIEAGAATPQAVALVARACANQGRLKEALEWCESAIQADKLYAGHHYLRASILLEQGALDEAQQALNRTLYLDSGFVLGHMALASLARKRGEVETAARHLSIVRRLLATCGREEIVPESEGITAGRLIEIIDAQQGQGLMDVSSFEGPQPVLGQPRSMRASKKVRP